MKMEDVEMQARVLFDELGPKAIHTAAQRAKELEDHGATEKAHVWRRIEQRLMERRGPRQG